MSLLSFCIAVTSLCSCSTTFTVTHARMTEFGLVKASNGSPLCATGTSGVIMTSLRSKVECADKCLDVYGCEWFNYRFQANHRNITCDFFVSDPISFSVDSGCMLFEQVSFNLSDLFIYACSENVRVEKPCVTQCLSINWQSLVAFAILQLTQPVILIWFRHNAST